MRICFTLIFFLIGCASTNCPTEDQVSDPPPCIWMLTKISVGKQCVSSDLDSEFAQKQAEIKAKLTAAGIQIYEEEMSGGATCRGCNVCPAFVSHYYIRVNQDIAKQAAELGFLPTQPPARN